MFKVERISSIPIICSLKGIELIFLLNRKVCYTIFSYYVKYLTIIFKTY